MPLKLLKFDTINPQIYILNLIKENQDEFQKMKREEFLEWMISTRGNFSDFYTYNLSKSGWETQEFFMNEYYLDKTADELYKGSKKFKKIISEIKNKIRPIQNRWEMTVLGDYIKKYKPDVIFVREQIGIPSVFWKGNGNNSLVVSRIATPIPKFWSPIDWDLILTSTETYKKFFEVNGIQSVINENGFDERILDELEKTGKKYDVTFVGGLGDRNWKRRTRVIEYISGKTDFKWWGYNANKYEPSHPINKSYMGITSGLKMLNIYRQSKIVFNDYGEIAEGAGVNQRLFEVLGVGSLLLTREAENLEKNFPPGIFVTFKDEKDCLEKINYYLTHEKEREEIALAGQKYILENFSYKKLMHELDAVLKESYYKKFPNGVKPSS